MSKFLTPDDIQEVLRALIDLAGETHLHRTRQEYGLKSIQDMNGKLHYYLDKIHD